MKTEFTPGPWTVILRGERGTFHIEQAKRHESEVAAGDGMDGSYDGMDGYSVSKANARLIAVAPRMYEVLCMLDSVIDFGEPVSASGRLGYVDDPAIINRAFELAKAALAEADGKAS